MSGEQAAMESGEGDRIPNGTKAVAKGTMVGVPKGTPVIVRHQSPSEYEAGPRLYWLELDDYIYWSHGRSEAKGYWGTRAEFDVTTPPTATGAL